MSASNNAKSLAPLKPPARLEALSRMQQLTRSTVVTSVAAAPLSAAVSLADVKGLKATVVQSDPKAKQQTTGAATAALADAEGQVSALKVAKEKRRNALAGFSAVDAKNIRAAAAAAAESATTSTSQISVRFSDADTNVKPQPRPRPVPTHSKKQFNLRVDTAAAQTQNAEMAFAPRSPSRRLLNESASVKQLGAATADKEKSTVRFNTMFLIVPTNDQPATPGEIPAPPSTPLPLPT